MRVALMGLGMVAGTHVSAIAGTGGRVSLKGVLSRSPSRAAGFAESVAGELGYTPLVYDSVDAIARDPDIDFVLVCTPPNARAEIVSVLAGAGKPILMEKPIERTLPAAVEIVDICAARDVPLGIVFQHRMRASAQLLAKRLRDGSLGEIAMVEITVPWWRPQSYYDEPGRGTYGRDGGGVLISQAIHTLDLALSLTGAVRKVQAMASTTSLHRMESEDFVSAGLAFESGAVGSLVASTASYPGGAESIILHCENATAALRAKKLDVRWHDGRVEAFGEDGGTGGGADPMAFTHQWHQGIIEDFAEAIATGRPPICTGREALTVHRLIEALVRSSHEERAVLVSSPE